MTPYLFTSERLGFRNYTMDDLPIMYQLCSNKQVMEFFPKVHSEQDTTDFMHRMIKHQEEHGFCYYAVDLLESNSLIGFTGLLHQDYKDIFDPFVDIGWRLKPEAWGFGYATEGAKRCLEFGFNELKLEEIYSVAPAVNIKSIAVMKKIGMEKVSEFKHPKLASHPALETCYLYKVNKPEEQK